MKKIALGTTSNQKREILKNVIGNKYNIYPSDVSSGITDQPLDKNTTLRGAKKRAKNAFQKLSDAEIGVGMEAGLVKKKNELFLVCIVAVYDGLKFYIGVSSKLKLPNMVSKLVNQGGSFGELIRNYKEEHNQNKKYTNYLNDLIDRDRLFKEAITNAFQIYNHRMIL